VWGQLRANAVLGAGGIVALMSFGFAAIAVIQNRIFYAS
jgi:hypothetical protein